MAKHLFGIVVTPHGTAANNRGENEGNLTTLQKILWNGDVHTSVSAEAIRWALRYSWQERGLAVNRTWDEERNQHTWQDPTFVRRGDGFIDDDVLGYMSARAAEQEAGAGDEQAPVKKGAERGRGASDARQERARGTTDVRRARLEVTRAVSLTPWSGDVTFNAASTGATPSASKTGRDPVPYATEVHATRYQYGFALTPQALGASNHALAVLDGILELGEVAGNHSRFLYDFSPESIVLRWTNDFAPRMLYGFTLDEQGQLSLPEVMRRVEAGDIDAAELIVGGSIADFADGETLRQAGASVHRGVKAAAAEGKQRLRRDLGLEGS